MTENKFNNESLAIRAIELAKVVLELPLHDTTQQLAKLSSECATWLQEPQNTDANSDERRAALFHFFYHIQGFNGNWERFFQPENVLISQVLESRRGGPMLLGILLLHLAQQHKIPLYGIDFPGHFLLRYDLISGQRVYFDPFSQELLGWDRLQARLRGTLDPLTDLDPESHLQPLDNDGMIKRLLSVKKSAFIRAGEPLQALYCNQQLLALSPDDPYEIRDRGFLFEQLDCYQIAASDYEFFLSQCPDDPVVPLLKVQMRALEQKESILH